MLHTLLDALRVQIWTAKPAGELDFVNRFTADYFGRTREELIGEGWTNVFTRATCPGPSNTGRARCRRASPTT
jgi:PAS domain-containing protein